ncbi:hypothetical protein DFH94DRAFT_295818 [Russula ochroleuca]|jgi:hypothetical protein|uniref:Secreted protein n=1 Tax=Russula ochroleuca TaxID=152965 RepID=A0A9P5JXD8_9AGAM|nr:hypothetical protein DFH94DRAFT_295818 [Russula ochroleuca]
MLLVLSLRCSVPFADLLETCACHFRALLSLSFRTVLAPRCRFRIRATTPQLHCSLARVRIEGLTDIPAAPPFRRNLAPFRRAFAALFCSRDLLHHRDFSLILHLSAGLNTCVSPDRPTKHHTGRSVVRRRQCTQSNQMNLVDCLRQHIGLM